MGKMRVFHAGGPVLNSRRSQWIQEEHPATIALVPLISNWDMSCNQHCLFEAIPQHPLVKRSMHLFAGWWQVAGAPKSYLLCSNPEHENKSKQRGKKQIITCRCTVQSFLWHCLQYLTDGFGGFTLNPTHESHWMVLSAISSWLCDALGRVSSLFSELTNFL